MQRSETNWYSFSLKLVWKESVLYHLKLLKVFQNILIKLFELSNNVTFKQILLLL